MDESKTAEVEQGADSGRLIGQTIWRDGAQLVGHVDHQTGTVRIAVDIGGWVPLISQEVAVITLTRDEAARLAGLLNVGVSTIDEGE